MSQPTPMEDRALTPLRFRRFVSDDRAACLALFDANCPASFAPNERADYAAFLARPSASYEVCVDDERIVGAYGLAGPTPDRARLTWILLDPTSQGRGLGTAMMRRAIAAAAAMADVLDIAASHKSAPFFARFGAQEVGRTRDGWGRGMHRVDMELSLPLKAV